MTRADEERIEDILDAAIIGEMDPDQVWTIVTRDVPALAERLRRGG